MLPFHKPTKTFQCFVCGLQFTVFDEFTAHILEKHEEGRDYVLCPLERCRTPVRDVRSHFRVHHKTEKVPPVGQMKAIIWKDVAKDGKMKTRKPKFREGYYDSMKMKKTFHYRSGMEANVYEHLDMWNEVLAYEVEPFEIPYIHDGECHKYIPDIFVVFADGRKEVWEIKPSNQTHFQKNKDKWFAAVEACKLRGWGFEIMTETQIEKLRKIIKEQHLR